MTTLANMRRPGRVVVGGDFNLHHPVWSAEDRHSAGAEKLLEMAENWGLELVTTPGEPTWSRQGCRPSTLDLFWCSSGIRRRYEGAWEWAGSDHLPQAVSVWGVGAAPRAAPRPNWKMMEPGKVEKRAKEILLPPITSKETLDAATDGLIRQLIDIQNATVPMTKPSKGRRSKAFWNHRTVESTRRLREAERNHRNRGTDLSADQLRQARAEQKKTLAQESTRSWRETTAEATRNPRLLWSLAAWGKNRSHVGTERAHMPDLDWSDGRPPATSMVDKADALAERFFPDTRPGEAPTPGPSQRWFPSELPSVTKEDVEGALRRPRQWKAPGTDGLANGFLRACGPPLVRALRTITTASLALGYYPRAFKQAKVGSRERQPPN